MCAATARSARLVSIQHETSKKEVNPKTNLATRGRTYNHTIHWHKYETAYSDV
jgi:hypothetical protein